jgi:hypothetical protein
MGGAKGFVFVSLQHLDPAIQVRGVLRGIVRNSALGRQKQAGQLGAQLLLGVIHIPKTVGLTERSAIQARRMTTPVGISCRAVP